MLLTRPRRRLLLGLVIASLLAALALALVWPRPGTRYAALGAYRTYGLTEWLLVFENDDGSFRQARLAPAGLLPALMIAAAAVAAGWWSHRRLVGVLSLRGRCDWCGYDLTGLTSPRCPECGHAPDGSPPPAKS